jgi:hypothetical protein
MQSESDSSWLLPHVCTHPVHTTGVQIVFLLYSGIILMHRLLEPSHVWSQHHQERDRHVNYRSPT